MEELLNKLIEKGWKPRGLETKRFDGEIYYAEFFEYYSNGTMLFDSVEYSIRELVSKESGLWQFCCRNKLVDGKPEWIKVCGGVVREEKQSSNSHYRIIESSLIDEDKLEQFLLDNIKIEGQ